MMHHIRAGLALACTSLSLAALAEPAAARSATDLAIPWGDWLVGLLQPGDRRLVPSPPPPSPPASPGPPWAASVLTRDRIEAAIRAGPSSAECRCRPARGRTVGVDVGAAVVAAGARHVLATAPAHVVRKAAGPRASPRGSSGAAPRSAGERRHVLAPA